MSCVQIIQSQSIIVVFSEKKQKISLNTLDPITFAWESNWQSCFSFTCVFHTYVSFLFFFFVFHFSSIPNDLLLILLFYFQLALLNNFYFYPFKKNVIFYYDNQRLAATAKTENWNQLMRRGFVCWNLIYVSISCVLSCHAFHVAINKLLTKTKANFVVNPIFGILS